MSVSNTSGGGIIDFNSVNHVIYGNVGYDSTADVLDFHEYGQIRFYTGGDIASQTQRMSIGATGVITMEGSTVVDTTSTEALLVRKNSDGGDVLSVDATNTSVKLGPGAGVHNSLLSLYGPPSTFIGPHTMFTSTDDIYPLFQQFNWSHDNIALNFDIYWDDINYISSDPGSNYQMYKQTDQLQFRYGSGGVCRKYIYSINRFLYGHHWVGDIQPRYYSSGCIYTYWYDKSWKYSKPYGVSRWCVECSW